MRTQYIVVLGLDWKGVKDLLIEKHGFSTNQFDEDDNGNYIFVNSGMYEITAKSIKTMYPESIILDPYGKWL